MREPATEFDPETHDPEQWQTFRLERAAVALERALLDNSTED